MRWGLLDIAAAGAFVLVLVLPSPSRPIRPQYPGALAALSPAIAEAQAQVARAPDDAAAAARLADVLVRARQTDWAIRAGARAAQSSSPERWRALVAVSAAHIDRLEIGLGYEWAKKALAACDETGADCPGFERTRLEMYTSALEAVHASGADPKRNPNGLIEAAQRAVPLIRLGKAR